MLKGGSLATNCWKKRINCNHVYRLSLKSIKHRGTWMAQSVKCLILDFGSGQDLGVLRSSPVSSSMLGVEPA